MSKRFGLVLVAVATLVGWTGGGTPASGQLLSSFENNLNSSAGTATWQINPAHNFTNVGATEGTSALEFRHPKSWVDASYLILRGGLPLAQLAANNQFMAMDVTTKDLGVANDGLAPAFRQVFIIYNSGSGGWQQNGAFNIPVAADDGGSVTSQVTLDLTAGISANAAAFVAGGGAGYWELFFVFQGNDLGPAAGDYNNDGNIDAADYTAWRDHLGGTIPNNETVTLGVADGADYDEWKSHFGVSGITTIVDNIRFLNGGAGSLSGSAAPEPSSVLLAMCVAVAVSAIRRNRK